MFVFFGNGFGAKARVLNVSLNEITELEIINKGEDYNLDDNLIIENFNLPKNLLFSDNTFMRIKRNIDLPDNFYYDKNNNKLKKLNLFTKDYYFYIKLHFLKNQLINGIDVSNFF